MTPQSNLDLTGDFQLHPLAELLVEISQAKLTGSLRISLESKKTIIYFRNGALVFGVSNVREYRLFHRLLKEKRIEQSELRGFNDLSNDMELAAWLRKRGTLTEDDINGVFVAQISDIVVDALTWPQGNWVFSPTARLRSDVDYTIGTHKILIDYARCVPGERVVGRLAGVEEHFVRQVDMPDIPLQPQETFVLEVFQNEPISFHQLKTTLNMPESGLAHALYALWLGGLVIRANWNRAFSEGRIADIKQARFSKIRDAARPAAADAPVPTTVPETAESEITNKPASPALPEMTLDEWLAKAEAAETHYDVLGIDEKADLDQIKSAYFGMAKLFHPDRYHRETGPRLRQIQVAFTGLAHAYETLKTTESREAYNYKIRKELELREKRVAAGETENPGVQFEQALESFEQGLRYLNDEEYGAAAALLARAVHYNPENALYRAYHGVALAGGEKEYHRAESELQAASKLEPNNAKIRLMLVQFFLDRNLKKRAEGELLRFLDIAPNNKEARSILAGLQKQT